MGTVMLRVSAVARRLGGAQVLEDVSLDVCGGDVFGLVGPNGAGKTTLVRIVLGLTRPDTGKVEMRAPATGYLPEERGLYQRQTVRDTLIYLARLKGLSAAHAAAEVARWLDRVDLTHAAGRRVEQLSKGQQQKIQIATAFIGDPGLLVLDEPFTGLDPLNTRLVCDLARDAAAAGTAVLISAHQLPLVEQICTHVLMLSRGRVVLAGTMADIRRDHRQSLEDLFVARAASGGER